jgi:putative membrane protein
MKTMNGIKSMRMRAAVLAVAAICTSGVVAQAQDTASQDKAFLMKSSEGGMAEIQMSQLALKKSKNPDVRQYAQKMIDDHTTLLANMKPFATQMGVQPPMKLNPEHMQEMARLKGMSGESFDKEYITAMVGDHHKDLGEFMTERDTTQNADLKTAVAQGTDVIKQHTEMIDTMAQAKGIATPPMPTASE